MTDLLLAVQKSHPCADEIKLTEWGVQVQYSNGLTYAYKLGGYYFTYIQYEPECNGGRFAYSPAGVKILN